MEMKILEEEEEERKKAAAEGENEKQDNEDDGEYYGGDLQTHTPKVDGSPLKINMKFADELAKEGRLNTKSDDKGCCSIF